MKSPVICLMGPTAAGKTPLAIELVQRFPCEIISVDSAMVYREMDIGTAKPTAEILRIAPHRLIDILDPAEAYSVGQFRDDALQAIIAINKAGKIPLLVGGTMLYFRILQQGLAQLPRANVEVRERLQARAEQEGLHVLHEELSKIDSEAAQRIHPSDSQRIQRALEVYEITGKPLSVWQQKNIENSEYNWHFLSLIPEDRAQLHHYIALRFQQMLAMGFVDEVKKLFSRGDLSLDLPSMRAVGYRQIWTYLSGEGSYEQMQDKAIAATRQLAKRQLTWLRSWPDLHIFAAYNKQSMQQIFAYIEKIL